MKTAGIRILVGIGVVLLVLAVSKNLLAKAVVTGGVKAITGLNLDIKGMDVGVLRSAIGIKGLVLRNPSGFSDPVMVSIPEVYVDYDLGAFLGGKVHLEEVRLHLEEVAVIKNKEGLVNLDALKTVQASKKGGSSSDAGAHGGEMPELQIDALSLKVGTVIYRDYSKGAPAKVQEFAVNIDDRFENISNPNALMALIVTRALASTAVARLTGLNLNALEGEVGERLGRATDAARSAASAATSGATEAGKKALGSAQEAASGAANALKGLLGD